MFKENIRIKNLLQSLSVLIFLIFLSVNIFAQERTWATFTPQTGAWSILAPGVLKPDPEALETSSTKGSYSYTDYNGFFAVVYRDTPRRYVPWKPNYKSYYKKIRNDAVKAANGQLVSDNEFTNGVVKGREVHIKIPNGKVTGRESSVQTTYRIERFRMFFHGKRFYLVLAVLPQDQINSPVIDNYLNSFAAQ